MHPCQKGENMAVNDFPPGFQEILSFGFIEALLGRRISHQSDVFHG